jgi:hypothetical protein
MPTDSPDDRGLHPTIGCQGCGAVLTDEERHYYGTRCETCESEWSDRVTAWRKGAADPELDAQYDGPQRTLN